jgi:hypothetical protein
LQAPAHQQEPERPASAQLAASQTVRRQQDSVVSAQQYLAKQQPEHLASVR